MFRTMQHRPAQSSPSSPNFAGLLAAIASPSAGAADNKALWSDGDLGEDVATLSYEHTLRAHARYKPADRGDWAGAESAELQRETAGAAPLRAAGPSEAVAAKADGECSSGRDGDLRRASVTIRLSQAELEQLRQRAYEAGLTISAYLRSCTFEAEALRAQVKQALAEIRKAGNEGTRGQGSEEPQRRNGFGWIARIAASRRGEQHSTQGKSVSL